MRNLSKILLFHTAIGALLAPATCVLAQNSDGRLEEIIVTAERRTSNVQNTAAAITAVSGEDLERMGVIAPEDLRKVTPGLYATVAGNILQFYVRGVGNYAANAFADAAVSFNLDGVTLSRPTTYAGLFFDLNRVEVLMGPQGTLYGRNATGGAINLLSARPEIDGEFGGYLRGDAGNEEYYKLNGAVNLPVSDRFALRAAGQVVERDSYYNDDTGDAGTWSGRLSALFEPSDRVSLQLITDYQNVDHIGIGSTIIGPNNFFDGNFIGSDPWEAGAISAEANALLAASSGFLARGPMGDPDPFNEAEIFGLLGQLDWELGLGNLTVLASYRDADYHLNTYFPGFMANIDEQAEQTSFEVRLASARDEGLDWVVGAYYFDETIDTDSFFFQDLNYPFAAEFENSTRLEPDLDTESQAVFGQLTFHISDQLRLTGSVRYTDEEKTMGGRVTGDPIFSGPATLEYPLDGADDWQETTWKVTVEFDLSDDSMLYANVSTGFKAGGYFAEQLQFGNTYDPEEIIAYSLGSKNRFLEDRLQINAELYYWDYEDHQESHLTASPARYNLFITENIGTAEMAGIDLDLEFLLTANARISVQLQYLDAEFTEFKYSAASVGPPLVGCPATPLGGLFYEVNCDGFDAIRAPEWAGTLGYQQLFALGEGKLVFDVSAQYSDEYFTSIDYLPAQLQESYTWIDASLTWRSADDKYSLGLWGRNLTEEEVSTGGFVSPFTNPGGGLVYGTQRAPRTYGVSFGVNF